MNDLAYRAMIFAREAHAQQVRKYTGNPYADHLAEVAGIVATVLPSAKVRAEIMLATAWLHDYVEDCRDPRDYDGAGAFFNIWYALTRAGNKSCRADEVAEGVLALSDLETGNRAERKELSRIRLAAAPGWVQTIKCADLISNTSSIVKHDPKFALTYLEEKRLLLDVLTRADRRLLDLARGQVA